MLSHAKIAEAEPHPVRKTVQSLWDIMIVRGLGLIPIRDAMREIDHQAFDAFEILRVSLAYHFVVASTVCQYDIQVRNRFACANPVGGYRDINFKIRVGFKSDLKSGKPLFCPV
jgi:hypothetical protein